MPRPERTRRPWVVIFILLSLLAHLLLVLTIVVVSRFLPAPKLKTDAPLTSVSLSLEDAPPPSVHSKPPPPKHTFFPTTPDKDARHKETQIESDNDTRLKSKSQIARTPDSVMPDVTTTHQHPANLNNAPNAPSKQPPHPAQTSSTTKSNQQQRPSPQTAPSAQQTQAKSQQAQQPVNHNG